ncbi:DUF6492 family protein [Pseudarthrobacter sp. LMD1-1-1.1]|uniref:DUF6492 family protein n=1 Tax=Pseudarthrobacter sp. LMD1-1-1.1 TaxID=3135242 RepID=UPI00341503F8
MVQHRLSLAIITPSYSEDLELCRDLTESVTRFTGETVKHFVLVPGKDKRAFEQIAGPRTVLQDVRSYLPPTLVKVPYFNCWLNLRQPFPPVRGWVAQQIVKLAAAAAMDTDVVLLVDSDVLLIRHIDAGSFAPGGELEFFEAPDGINESLPRHHLWHAVARRLLGLPPVSRSLMPDYICWPCAWSPSIVREMLQRVESVTGKPWATAIGGELHFSEMILYGVYVREVLSRKEKPPTTTSMRCLNYSEESPLDESALKVLVQQAGPEDIAIMVSAKSGTPLSVRRRILGGFPVPDV